MVTLASNLGDHPVRWRPSVIPTVRTYILRTLKGENSAVQSQTLAHPFRVATPKSKVKVRPFVAPNISSGMSPLSHAGRRVSINKTQSGESKLPSPCLGNYKTGASNVNLARLSEPKASLRLRLNRFLLLSAPGFYWAQSRFH